MGKLIDLTGQRFGRLVVLRRAGTKVYTGATAVLYECVCDCGNKTIVFAGALRKGTTQSCGCLHNEQLVSRSTTHGKRKSRLYSIYAGMKRRCYIHTDKRYERYGGRGITVCDEWRNDFQSFYDWSMANGYRDDLSIDRIDNDKGYSPDNCRWATPKQQERNKSNKKLYEVNGEKKLLADWCDIYGVDCKKAGERIRRYKWTVEEALELVPRKKN